MRYISIDKVKEGVVVALPIYNEHEMVLVNQGVTLTNAIIKKLKEKDISDIAIEDDLSEGIDVYDSISQKIKTKCVSHLKNFNMDKALEDANKIVDELKNSSGVYEYFNTKTYDNYTYEHSISVSVYATMLGLAAGLNDIELRKLASAAILHDVGKKCIDYDILHKLDRLTPEEYEIIKTHTTCGYNMLRDTELQATVKIVTLEHHENWDGTGYPRQLKGNDIYKFSRIVHIADVYDAMISRRPYKEPIPTKEVIDFIIEKSGSMFDENYVNLFIQIMPSYARGSIVLLNDGRKAIVVKNILGDINRPQIRILDTKEMIMLKDNRDLEIVEKLN